MFFIFFLTIILFVCSMNNLKSNILFKNLQKLYSYECGYMEMSSFMFMYSSQFFMLALSFMLFDLEIVFFLPYFIMYFNSQFMMYILMLFFMILMISLYYELFNKIV